MFPRQMKRKGKHGFLIFIFSVLAILLVVGVLLSLDLVKRGPAKINEISVELPSEIIPHERFIREVTAELPGKAYCSELMDAVLLDLSNDVKPSDTVDSVMAQLYGAFLWYRNCDADTVFIRPGDATLFDGLRNDNGTPFDLMAAAVSYAKTNSCYTVLTVDESFLSGKGSYHFSDVSDMLMQYGFDALYYEPVSHGTDAAFLKNARRLRNDIDASGIQVSFGCGVDCDGASNAAGDRRMQDFFAENTADFVCVIPHASALNPSYAFRDEVSAWNTFAARYPDTVFYCAIQQQAVRSSPTPAKEIAGQIDALFDQEHFRGCLYGSNSSLIGDASVMRQISEYCYREDPFNFAVNSMTLSPNGDTVVFGGKAIDSRKLTIDRTVIAPNGGPFAVTCSLINGINRFSLRNAGFTNRFTVEKISSPAQDGGVSPYSDNGLGRALMCRVNDDLTQPMSYSGDYDTFHPDFSDLPAGTLDYVKTITFEEGIRYELASGLCVAASDATLLCNAYAMPANTVSYMEQKEESNRTGLVFGTDWKVPVRLSLSPQPYSKGFADFSYNVSSFSAQYLDAVFYHTEVMNLPEGLTFDESSPIQRAETFKNENGGVTLRLWLKEQFLFRGAECSCDEEGRFVISVKKKPSALSAARVMLDPGHGGEYMTGTALNDDSLAEKEVTLDLALKVRDILLGKGIEVRLTREADVSMTLSERKKQCHEYDPDLYVSIHCDGVDDMGQSGTHSFYYKPFSQPLAESVHRRLVDVYASVIYASVNRSFDQIDKSIKYYPFYVTRVDQCPSILVESGFMTNDFEGRILADENCRYWLADAIAGGICDYLNR